MRWLLALLLVLTGFGCRKPESVVVAPQARLIVHFLDQDAVLNLAARPPDGAWRWMNAGLWEPLDVRWKEGAPCLGAVVVGRTAPDWLLLEDPAEGVHRVVMRGPGPEELARRNEQMDPEEREALAFLGLLWALAWGRH